MLMQVMRRYSWLVYALQETKLTLKRLRSLHIFANYEMDPNYMTIDLKCFSLSFVRRKANPVRSFGLMANFLRSNRAPISYRRLKPFKIS